MTTRPGLSEARRAGLGRSHTARTQAGPPWRQLQVKAVPATTTESESEVAQWPIGSVTAKQTCRTG